ncbi:MAG: PD-(D/E)XK nuclease family protein, partial [Gammaproteobacteria bacterium]|nr:PD-(D/E)XK nuclease family protein [Gammaproteobacteria bacterium]
MNLTLTATARQARYLRDRWGDDQLQRGVAVWETPAILSVSAWIREQWDRQLQRGADLPHLLSAEQERVVWRQTIPHELLGEESFLRKGDLVEHAIVANQIFNRWRERGAGLPIDSHVDEQELFRRWQLQFKEYCERHDLLEHARIAEWLRELLFDGGMEILPETVSIYGASQFSRSERQIIEQLNELGCEVREEGGVSISSVVVKSSLPSESEEEVAVAYWLRDYLQDNPGHKVAVVVPGLYGRRNRLERLFGFILMPETRVRSLSNNLLPYRFSSGPSLLQDPRINTAMQLMELAGRGLPLQEAASLLRSPWLLQGAEIEVRSILELRLRHWRNPEVSLATLIRLFEQESVDGGIYATRFLGALRALEGLWLSEARLTTTEWAGNFSRVLAFFEWAENGEKSDIALAAYNSWRDGLDRFSSIGDFTGVISFSAAILEFRQILARMDIQYDQAVDAAVEIVTPEEARGVGYDALWVMGMDDRSWPARRELSPFLSLEWQRGQVPMAACGNNLKIAEEMVAGFSVAADKVFFSFAESSEGEGGEESLRATSMVGDVPFMDYQSLGLKTTVEKWWLDSDNISLEEIDEGALSLQYGSRVRGGSSILANQSQCPFRAFVRHRLQAESVEREQLGLDPRERGTLVHNLLERCWQQLGLSSIKLKQIDEQVLRSLVAAVAEETVEKFRHSRKDRMGDDFAANEAARLSRLAMRFLQLDRGRVAEFRIEEMEQLHTIALDGITISVKMDRVDRLEDGRRVLIDYKSGKVSSASWQGERPEEPQLPLYTTLLDDVAAVLFGQVQVGEVAYKGEQEDESLLKGADGKGRGGRRKVVVSGGWGEQIGQWRAVVTDLAVEFREGVATVDPLKGKNSCQYCG